MELSPRKRNILKAIVEQYVATAEPVGSKTIASDLHLSSATIRNEMAELTALGLLEQPHTSAGRIPSAQGYRVYVNELMNEHRLSLEETQEINRALRQKMQRLDKLLDDAGRVVSELTNYPSLAVAASVTKQTVQRYDLIRIDEHSVIAVLLLDNGTAHNRVMSFPNGISQQLVGKLSAVFNAGFTQLTADKITPSLIRTTEESIGDDSGATVALAGFTVSTLEEAGASKVLNGLPNLLSLPEYQDVDKAHRILNFLSDQNGLPQLPDPGDESDVKILIGPENVAEELKDSGVVLASYELGNNMRGVIGVVGPTRMNYAKVAAYLSYIAGGMKQLAQSGAVPQLEENKAKEQEERR